MAEIRLTKTSGARVSYTVADGGDDAARRVPVKGEGTGEGFPYQEVQDVEAESMARRRPPACPAPPEIARRS